MKNTMAWMCFAAGLATVWSMPASSQVRPEQQVRQRQAGMILQGKYFYPIRNQAQGKIPYDPKIVARNVTYLDQLARMPWDGFTPATKGVESRATPAVLTDASKFKEAQDQFMAESAKLAELVRKGDEAATRQQILAVDNSCNNCHDAFRERR